MKLHAKTLSLVACLGWGCAGTETGNPDLIDVEPVVLAVSTSDSSVAQVGDSTGGFGISALQMRVGAVVGLDCEGNSITNPRDVEAGSFDLLEGTMALSVPFYEGQCGIQLQLAAAPANDPLTTLRGAALRVAGVAADGSQFAVHSSSALKVTIASPHELPLEDALLVSVDLADLFANLDLSDATVDAQGVVQLTVDSNAELLHSFEQHAPGAFHLYRDLDEDGTLSAPDALVANGHL